jgi:hypothetical protein
MLATNEIFGTVGGNTGRFVCAPSTRLRGEGQGEGHFTTNVTYRYTPHPDC